jgi:hypothetical protein
MRNILNLEEEKFYLSNSDEFDRIYEIISRMPNFILYENTNTFYTDYFYDTPDNFLKQNRATVRVRKYSDKQVLSIKYISSNALKEEKEREAYMDMPVDVEVTEYREAILFLSNKINDIYAKRLDIDTVRKMRDLKVYLVIYTDRETFELKNNLDLKISVHFDKLDYAAKFTKGKDNIVKFVLNNYPDTVNLDTFKRFISNINKKVYFINDNESKFAAASRILNYDRFKKKDNFEEDEEDEETSED